MFHKVSKDDTYRAWLMAVRHFMTGAGATCSAEEFLTKSPRLFERDILLSHYSSERLYSEQAREQFLAPDLDPIPPEKS